MCLVLSTSQLHLGNGRGTHLGAAILGLPSGLRSIFDSLVSHSTYLHKTSSVLSDGDAPGGDVSGCQTEHIEVSRGFRF